jgi:hypothetical protein
MKRKLSVTGSQRQYLREKVFFLSAACPSGQSHLCDCPFHALRNMNVMGKYEWHRRLSDSRLLGILAHHQKCLMGKADLKQQDNC